MTVATREVSRTSAPHGQLLQVLGLGFGIAVVVGGVVGQGILRSIGLARLMRAR